MQIDLTPEQENIVAEALRSGQYHDAKDVLDDALQALKTERLRFNATGSERRQAIERLRHFGSQHSLSLGPGLSVKDLINQGRR